MNLTDQKIWLKVSLSSAFLLMLLSLTKAAYAQWPPFSFEMTPSHQNGEITYAINFSKKVDNALTDVVINIPLPEGTRFLQADAPPTTSVTFDGVEITFFTATLHRPINNASFTVEIIDTEQTLFATQAWIAWQGNPSGDYLQPETTLDLNKHPLNWVRPQSRLSIEAKAEVEDEIITYTFYPKKRTNRRMWDLKINVPLPEGTSLLSIEAPPPFVTNFDGREATFSLIEMDRRRDTGPLIMKVSADSITDTFISTHAWASWKNVGRSVGRQVLFQEETRSGEIVVQPHTTQQVAADVMGDTPFANYDLTGIALQTTDTALQVNFYAAAEIGPIGAPLEYILYLDTDCLVETGGKRGNRGAEYWLRYRHENGNAYLYAWNSGEDKWDNRQTVAVTGLTAKMINLTVPNSALEIGSQFCWLGRARNRSDAYAPNPPNEWVGSDSRLTRYQAIPGGQM